MGTRNLTMVVADGQMKVCQYGQWDGYPSGQGFTVLKFLRSANLETFKTQVADLLEITEQQGQEMNAELKRSGKTLVDLYPFMSRDTGATILQMIADGKVPCVRLNRDFVKDSLFCEWAYLIDLDQKTLEVYKGFQKEAHTAGRFASPESKDGYFPIALVATFPMDALPGDDEFCQQCDPPEPAEAE